MHEAQQGTVYEIAQWYPRMCVYDDVEAGTFCLIWVRANFTSNTVILNMPSPLLHHILLPEFGRTPIHLNAGQVNNLKRLAQASNSDKTVMIRSAAEEVIEANSRPKSEGKITWKFKCSTARDSLCFFKAFVIDAARINLQVVKIIGAMSAYPAESGGEKRLGRSSNT